MLYDSMYGRAAALFRSRTAKQRASSAVHASDVGEPALAEPPYLDPIVSDADAVAMTLAGRSDAFGDVVARYERAVYHVAVRMLRNVEEAEDATQETFLRAFRSLHTFRPDARFSTWILAIAYHAACDRLAKRRRTSYSELPDIVDTSPGPAATAEANDDAVRLRAAIDALPDKYRAVITLYHVQGRQYEQIAEVLGLPLGTVKTRLFRAKEQLRRTLGMTENSE